MFDTGDIESAWRFSFFHSSLFQNSSPAEGSRPTSTGFVGRNFLAPCPGPRASHRGSFPRTDAPASVRLSASPCKVIRMDGRRGGIASGSWRKEPTGLPDRRFCLKGPRGNALRPGGCGRGCRRKQTSRSSCGIGRRKIEAHTGSVDGKAGAIVRGRKPTSGQRRRAGASMRLALEPGPTAPRVAAGHARPGRWRWRGHRSRGGRGDGARS